MTKTESNGRRQLTRAGVKALHLRLRGSVTTGLGRPETRAFHGLIQEGMNADGLEQLLLQVAQAPDARKKPVVSKVERIRLRKLARDLEDAGTRLAHTARLPEMPHLAFSAAHGWCETADRCAAASVQIRAMIAGPWARKQRTNERNMWIERLLRRVHAETGGTHLPEVALLLAAVGVSMTAANLTRITARCNTPGEK